MGEKDRRAELIPIFINVFCKYGIDKTTTKKLAEEASLSEAGLYVYFKNKKDILLQCVGWHIRCVRSEILDLIRKFDTKPDSMAMAVFDYTKTMILQNRFIFQVLTHPHYSEMIPGFRNDMFLGFENLPESFVLKDAPRAITLLFNSALNNYILTRDEKGFAIQMDFLLKALQRMKGQGRYLD